MTPASRLQLLLRLFGTTSLAATIFVAAPESWMRDIHAALGLGVLPDEPIVGYLARSTSALYALTGGLFWTISFDPVRYRPVLSYLGSAVVLLGLSLFVVDWAEGLPTLWVFWEGPVVATFGILILRFNRSPDPEGG